MTQAEQTILEEIRALRNEQRSDRNAIFGEINVVRADVAEIATKGCAKGSEHSDHEGRIRGLETDRDKSKGMFAVIAAGVGAVMGLGFEWLGKKL